MKIININKELCIEPINKYQEYLNPDLIYIPIKDLQYLKCKKGQFILKGDIVYEGKEIIYSSISGIVKDIVVIKNKNYLLIQNDFKETTVNNGKSRRIKNMDKDTFLSFLNNNIKSKFNKDVNDLYINCIDIDPFIFNRYIYLKEELKELLDFLINIAYIFKFNKIYLVLTDQYKDIIDKYSINILESGVVTYKIVNNIYPIGNDTLLAKHLIRNKKDELINLNDLIKMLYLIKKNRPITEKFITINGNNVKNKMVLKVKKYSLVANILRITNNYLENVSYIENNSLMGRKIDINMRIVDDTLDGIIVNSNSNNKKMLCNRCGLCYNVCPSRINPLIKNDKCLKCGLCNYVCPHKINIVERYQK